MPRIKPNLVPAYPIHSLEDVDSGLARIAALKRQIDLINLSAAERMDEIKTGAAAEIDADPMLSRRRYRGGIFQLAIDGQLFPDIRRLRICTAAEQKGDRLAVYLYGDLLFRHRLPAPRKGKAKRQ